MHVHAPGRNHTIGMKCCLKNVVLVLWMGLNAGSQHEEKMHFDLCKPSWVAKDLRTGPSLEESEDRKRSLVQRPGRSNKTRLKDCTQA